MIVNNKKYITMSLMEAKSGKSANTIKQWLHTHNIKPISREALYEDWVLKALLTAPPPGKPKKLKNR